MIVIDDDGRADVVRRSALPPLPERPASVTVSAKAPADPTTVKRRSLVIIAVSVIACVVSVALLVLVREPSAPTIDVNIPLGEGNATLVAAVQEFRGPASLADYDAAAQRAEEASDNYAERLEASEGVEDRDVREAALRLLRAERRTVRAFASALGGLENTDLAEWGDRSLAVGESIDSLAAAEESLRGVGGEDITAEVNTDLARQVLSAVDRRMERKLEAFEDWQAREQAALDEQAMAASVINQYIGQVTPLIAQYSDSREDLQTWTDSFDTSATFEEAYTTLELHGSGRVIIRDNLSRVTAPPAFQSLHNELVGVIDQAADVVGIAVSAVDTFRLAPPFFYPNVQATPEWQRFVDLSDQIGIAYASVLGRWQTATSDEQARIARLPIPPEPVL